MEKITKHIIYNEQAPYVIYFEMDGFTLHNRNKLTLYYTNSSKELMLNIKEYLESVSKVFFSKRDINDIIKMFDTNFIELKLETKSNRRSIAKSYFKKHFEMFNNGENNNSYNKEVIKCGTLPIRYIPRKLS